MPKIAQQTRNLRHWLVKKLAPRLWNDYCCFLGADSVEFERPAITFLKQHFRDKPLIGCEVGVREGINALRILRTLNIERLYLVDPYVPYQEPLFPQASSVQHQETMKRQAQKLLKPYGGKVIWLTASSDNAIRCINELLDFCYIDGDHSYEQVKRDIENYGRLIRSGGVIGGNDFSTKYFGLCRAVLEFARKGVGWLGLQGEAWDWWVQKA